MSDDNVGIPRNEWESWESNFVHFHHFERMSTEKDHEEESHTFTVCDHEWAVLVYPGGDDDSEDGMVSLFLKHCSGPQILARFALLLRDTSGKVIVEKYEDYRFQEGLFEHYGLEDFVEREEILDPANEVLNNGTLTIEVRIQLDDDNHCMNFIPKNEFAQNMIQSFMDENTSDVIFQVKGRDESSTVSDLFHAHKVVLQFCAKGSTLASLCEDFDKSTPVPILDVEPQVFRQMLFYVYGGNILAAEWKERSKQYIDVADRYGVKNFKIAAEAWYVKHLKITVDNVIDTLIYADEKNCFLLKEACSNFVLENSSEVLASESFENMPDSKSITREIISLAAANNRDEGEDFGHLSINELRAMLYDKGEDFDGPRQRLIDQLEKLKLPE